MENKFKVQWARVENPDTFPRRYSGKTVIIDFEEFKGKVLSQENDFVSELVNSLYAGDVHIIKNAWSKDDKIKWKDKVHEFGKQSPFIVP